MIEMESESIINAKIGFPSVELDNEVALMNVNKGRYFGLGDTGSDIWKIIQKPISLDSLVNELMKLYDVDYDICKESTVRFLNKLYEEELIFID